jgi:hypothetical protein
MTEDTVLGPVPQSSQRFPLIWFFAGDDVMEDNTETIDVHSEAGRMRAA